MARIGKVGLRPSVHRFNDGCQYKATVPLILLPSVPVPAIEV